VIDRVPVNFRSFYKKT